MYHFVANGHTADAVVLNEEIELGGCAVQYLKDFQINGVRFLYENFCRAEFCILNDEKGLGKTATSAIFLGVIASNRNCLVVVSNNDERILSWKFHIDVLTELDVMTLNNEKDYNSNCCRVYIAKWNDLREIGDVSKLIFDIIIIDNREEILSNSFCTSNLLKNFENKVQLVISSVDITSNVKLLHNILRFGGHLEHDIATLKAFERKFQLPDLKAISNKKFNLEEYFIKREMLNDFCRKIRLRRYKHQFDSILPLVDPERYKACLVAWQEDKIKYKKTAKEIREIQPRFFENEAKDLQINEEVMHLTSKMSEEIDDFHAITMPLDITDDEMDMSPLVFFSDSEDELGDAMISRQNMKLLQDTTKLINLSAPQITTDNNSEEKECITKNPDGNTEKMTTERSGKEKNFYNNESMSKEKVDIKVFKSKREIELKQYKYKKVKCGKNDWVKKNCEKLLETENEIDTIKSNSSKHLSFPNGKTEQLISRVLVTEETKKRNKLRRSQRKKSQNHLSFKTQGNSHISQELTTIPKTPTAPKNENVLPSNAKQNPVVSIKRFKLAQDKFGMSKTLGKLSFTNQYRREKLKTSTESLIVKPPLRMTRSTQRQTRSRRIPAKCYALNFQDDKKVKKKTSKKSSRNRTNIIEDTNVIKSNDEVDKGFSPVELTVEIESLKDEMPTSKNNPEQLRRNSLQIPLLPSSSDYEDMQCGQKIVIGSNNGEIASYPTPTICTGLLLPSTPLSLRVSPYPLHQTQSPQQEEILDDSGSDNALITSKDTFKNRTRTKEIVIVLSSSQDEAASLSSTTSSEVYNTQSSFTQRRSQRRKRYSKRGKTSGGLSKLSSENKSLTFHPLLTHERRNSDKSPDVFSVYSDICNGNNYLSNILPFGQRSSPTSPVSNTNFALKNFDSEARDAQNTVIPGSKVDTQHPKRIERSCLNILQQMFKNQLAANDKHEMLSRRGRQQSLSNLNTPMVQIGPVQGQHQPVITSLKSTHEGTESLVSTDNVLNITNSATFGSTLRTNSNRSISPVQDMLSNKTINNRITNYLKDYGYQEKASIVEKSQKLFVTPKKKSQQDSLNNICGISGIGSTTRKSPNLLRCTQSTKLTKWFRRSSVDDAALVRLFQSQPQRRTRHLESTLSTAIKRRRLEFSFES